MPGGERGPPFNGNQRQHGGAADCLASHRVPFRDAGPEVAVERDSRRRVVEGIVSHTTPGGKTKGQQQQAHACLSLCHWLHITFLLPPLAPSDAELLGSMAVRLAQVEKELLAAMAEIVEKVTLRPCPSFSPCRVRVQLHPSHISPSGLRMLRSKSWSRPLLPYTSHLPLLPLLSPSMRWR